MVKKKRRISFLGAGKMGAIIVEGIVSAKLAAPGGIVIYDAVPAASSALAKKLGVAMAGSAEEAIAAGEIVFICVKPQQFAKAAAQLKGDIWKGRCAVSIMAGVKSSKVKELLGGQPRVVRVMPNVACLVSGGASAVAKDSDAPKDISEFVFSLFDSLGTAVWADEALMDAVTAISGSGPAYVFMMIEALIDAGVRIGLDRATSRKLAVQTVLGSAKMASESELSLSELRGQVSSPAGTTVAATTVLERRGFRSALIDAAIAAWERSRELGG